MRESSGDASKMKSASIDELEIKIAQLEEELKQARRENNDVKDRVMPSDTDGLPSELQGTDMAKAKSSLVRATRDVVSRSLSLVKCCPTVKSRPSLSLGCQQTIFLQPLKVIRPRRARRNSQVALRFAMLFHQMQSFLFVCPAEHPAK